MRELKTKEGRFNKSVRNKLMVILIVSITIPVCLLGYFSYLKSFNILEDKLSITSKQTIEVIAKTLDEYFEAVNTQINILGDNRIFKKISVPALIDNNLELNKQIAMEILKNNKDNNENINLSYFASRNKELYIYPHVDLPDGFDPTSRPWYINALTKKGEIVWTDPYLDTATGQITITVSKTVEENGEIIGVVASDISLDKLSSKIAKLKIGKKGYVSLASRDGIILTHLDKSLLGKHVNSKVWSEMKKNDEGFLKYNNKGIEQFTVFTTNKNIGVKIMAIMEKNELVDDTNIIKYFTIYGALIAIAIAVLISYFIAKIISTPLNILNKVFSKAASGDLTAQANIKSSDEFGKIGENFNFMMSNINNLIKEVKSSSYIVLESSSSLADITDETSAATNEVAVAIEEIARTSNEQSSDTQEGAEKIEEFAYEIERVITATDNINNISVETNKLSDKGLQIIELLSKKSKNSSDSTQRVNEIVMEVDKSANEIGAITQTITQIAEQTNLLALNAAIEAARAGDSGKGFAVVAEEVRKLAEESSYAAKEIKLLIDGIQDKSKNAVNTMIEAKDIVISQNKATVDTENVFKEISDSIKVLMKDVKEIKNFTGDMAIKKDEIVHIMGNLSASAQQTSASTEEVSASTEEQLASIEQIASYAQDLKNLADNLEKSINKFIV